MFSGHCVVSIHYSDLGVQDDESPLHLVFLGICMLALRVI